MRLVARSALLTTVMEAMEAMAGMAADTDMEVMAVDTDTGAMVVDMVDTACMGGMVVDTGAMADTETILSSVITTIPDMVVTATVATVMAVMATTRILYEKMIE